VTAGRLRAPAEPAEPAQGSGRPSASRHALATRLTAGWRASRAGATLPEHLNRYGPLPSGGRAGRRRGALTDAVAQAGLTGRGGSHFPTGTKMSAVASRRGPAVVVANGMEGEPASEKDHALLSRAPHLALDGTVLAAQAVGADVAHLCLPQTSQWLIDLMLAAVEERRCARLDRVRIEVHALPDRYVTGEETSLVRWLNGGEAKPVATPPRPFEKGVLNRPTLVDNVETLAHVALIARYGPAWFRQAGLPESPGTMLTTVSGAVEGPGVYEIELGTPIGAALAASGVSNGVGAVLIGGYFGTWHELRAVAGLPFTAPGLRRAGASPGTGVLFALPPGACGLAETARVLAYLAEQSAGQCGPCAFGLPAIAEDFAQIASGKPRGPLLDRLERRFRTVSGRGACRHPDGATRMAASALTAFAADVTDHLSRMPCAAARRGGPAGPALPVPRPSTEAEWR
jgi:NADH:ubiquinone oxidoreductase subunit F (NADH-binding)